MALEREELSGWLRLSLTAGVGNITARKLLSAFGLPDQVFAQPLGLLGHHVSAKQAQALQTIPAGLDDLLESTWQWLQSQPDSRRILTLGDAHYPASLLEMEDPPLMLYAIGAAQVWSGTELALNPAHAIAVVGSRNPTTQGASNARQFAQALAQAGLTVVSGLAMGVDGAAHEGALAGGVPGQICTVAVVGTGLDRVYPKQHHDLAHRIAQQGLILSEYTLGTPPLSDNFPRRNRIIAGLSNSTLVVEAALQSGSLITARMAVEQGKDVFAIPGSIYSMQARGCHALIKQGAKLVENAQDILEDVLPQSPSPAHAHSQSKPGVAARLAETSEGGDASLADNDIDDPLWTALGFDPVGLDLLLARTGLDTPSLQVRLMELELAGRVARLPGGLFQKVFVA
jgi:DNA processing protein